MLTRILIFTVLSGPKFRKDRQAKSLKRVVGRHFDLRNLQGVNRKPDGAEGCDQKRRDATWCMEHAPA